MLSGVQEQKIRHLFGLIDIDDDEHIEEEDFLRFITNLAGILGYATTSPEYQQLRATYLGTWTSMVESLDKNRDSRISWDEYGRWFASVKDAMQESGLVDTFAGQLFDLWDMDKDGLMSATEHGAVLKAYERHDVDPEENFRRIDANGDGQVSRDEFLQLSRDFFFSTDPNNPGNYILGPY